MIRLWVAEIRELAYDAEDVVEEFALKIGFKSKGGLPGCIKKSTCIVKKGCALHETKSKIEKIIARIIDLVRRLQAYGVRELKDGREGSSSQLKCENQGGLILILWMIILLDWLMIPRNWSQFLRMRQMNAVGLFQYVAWVVWERPLSPRKYFTMVRKKSDKELAEDRKKSDKELAEDRKKSDEEIAKKLCNILKDKKCLVILDDIWNSEAWIRLKPAFPAASDSHSKILLTSRNKEIVSDADIRELRCLNNEQSWELFQKIAFPPTEFTANSILATIVLASATSNESTIILLPIPSSILPLEFLPVTPIPAQAVAVSSAPSQLTSTQLSSGFSQTSAQVVDFSVGSKKYNRCGMKELGENMVKHCARLPLAIVVLGGILATKNNSLNEWRKISDNKGKNQELEDVLALSYDDLPPYLRPCFLYLSHFLEDYTIEVDRLIQLWVAEGIVSLKQEERVGGEIAKDVAESYLMELVERCMIQVRERDVVTLKVKTIQLHDLMRDLCLSKAKQENFVFIVDRSNASSLSMIRKALQNSTPLGVWNYIEEHGDEVWNPLYWILATSVGCSRLLKAWGIWRYLFNNFKLLRVLNYEVGIRYDDFAGWKLC
ncbi:hypothetical protein GOBAR_AA35490 [Gossypium barbadense]|uniref:NB-ARC domain-containing protein n=1 Tax=Gossypium barbadense TaxID=3634 RepID=A0A2P5W2A9_GOSBA|nr:hypothetical protein GOBAR_AA35490 [Gossypium barbadense]